MRDCISKKEMADYNLRLNFTQPERDQIDDHLNNCNKCSDGVEDNKRRLRAGGQLRQRQH